MGKNSQTPALGAGFWLRTLLPLLLLVGLIAVIRGTDIAGSLRGEAPPVEELHVERTVLDSDGIVLTILNDGPDPVKVAQVMVDEAYWSFAQTPPGSLAHLGRAKVAIPYPWVKDEAHEIVLLTSTGVTFAHEIEVAVATPKPSRRFLGLFTLIGLYVGVLPVALGLLWYPALRRVGRRALDFVLALTVGLLIFLFVDTVEDGLEAAHGMAESFQGVVLFTLAALLAYLAIEAFGSRMKARGGDGAWTTALLVAFGIGVHNLGEGLAIGGAFALGEASLGTLLILGFALHNTTEGLAIVAPLARAQVGWPQLAALGLIAGAPTIAGAWLGGFVYSPVLAVAFLAIGAGAIAQVVVQILRGVAVQRPLTAYLASGPVVSGLTAGFAIMYITALLIG